MFTNTIDEQGHKHLQKLSKLSSRAVVLTYCTAYGQHDLTRYKVIAL